MGIASKLTPQGKLVVLIELIIIKFLEFQNLTVKSINYYQLEKIKKFLQQLCRTGIVPV